MGSFQKAHAEGIKRKRKSFASVANKGFDPLLEDECHALKAEDELRSYWVDKCLSERAAARQAAAAALALPAAPPAAAALAPPALALAPPTAAAALPPPAAADELQAPPAAEVVPAPPAE